LRHHIVLIAKVLNLHRFKDTRVEHVYEEEEEQARIPTAANARETVRRILSLDDECGDNMIIFAI
jgi:hypothetical protein